MMSAESLEFLPAVKALAWIARIARALSTLVQPAVGESKTP